MLLLTAFRTFRNLLAAQRVAALRKDDDLQATLLNLLLRNYFAFNLYDQADKLIAKTTFPDTAGNNQLARWLYYVGMCITMYIMLSYSNLTQCPTAGRIRAIQLNYTEAHTHLQQAIRRAPHASIAPGFVQSVGFLMQERWRHYDSFFTSSTGLQAVHCCRVAHGRNP